MDIRDLENPTMLTSLKSLNDSNQHLLISFVGNSENYINGKLDLKKLMHRLNERSQMPRTNFKIDSEKEKCLILGIEQCGYTFEIKNGTRVVKQKQPSLDENYNEIASKGVYGTGLGETNFGKTCYISCLPKDMFEDELLPLFATYGKIVESCLKFDPATGDLREFAFVTFKTRDSARLAALNVIINENNV